MNFPEIDYAFWLKKWNETTGNEKVYSNENTKKHIEFFGTTNECEKKITASINTGKTDKKTILHIIDLITVWGGKSGRMLYAKRENKLSHREALEKDDEELEIYRKAVELAKEGHPASKKVFSVINGIGPSFASKHSFFWSINSANRLIIVDSKIAGALGYKTIEDLDKKYKYSEVVQKFTKKALSEFKIDNPTHIEKALFAFHSFYFLNNNKLMKKTEKESKDYEEAQKLNKILHKEESR